MARNLGFLQFIPRCKTKNGKKKKKQTAEIFYFIILKYSIHVYLPRPTI